ncbi:MAG: RNA-binding protein [Paenibacillus sp. RIFOXYA1_FULL_44_5]|nr:MAG: RNA-binding protein [Paenibacillus sp. RIFOXYA1_FULL_44_5]
MNQKPEFYAHFHPDEHTFVDQAIGWASRAENKHEIKHTDFLDPRQQFILTSISNRFPSLQIVFAGGYPDAERKRAWIAPDYLYVNPEETSIEVLHIASGDTKMRELEHGDYLGAILGLGIKREKIGDIHVHEDFCQVLIASEIIQYIDIQLHQVHRVQVSTEIVSASQLQPVPVQLQEMNITVASMRLDGIASDVFRMSRTKILVPIKAGRCRVNWKAEENPSHHLQSGDVVSLKGFGRFTVLSVDGITKKGNFRVKIGKYS